MVVLFASVAVYATQRPSGEKTASIGVEDCTPPKGTSSFSVSDDLRNDRPDPFVTLYRNTLPFGDQDSGTCEVPCSALVSRSALPPAVDCHQIPRSPSRS